MASKPYNSSPFNKLKFFLGSFLLLINVASAQLSSNFYGTTCPNALATIKSAVNSAVSNEARMGASLLRLHFHDCFVNASPPFFLLLISTYLISTNYVYNLHILIICFESSLRFSFYTNKVKN